ncbi:MFS transporter [Robertkochia solimangrovi]|uniref:MFS transporter n=1 Tax=Robertkochia solimangrovi TaxID=2213046 RepID=UPI00117F4123|nr:MFS transporter [Robertkochia solimangrovi]TRZ43544.1 MFS transporter [Robertkochia solimangrovi]
MSINIPRYLKRVVLLVVIYIAFISLGLPDSLLGAAWPEMYRDLKVPVHYAGIISMIIAGGTVVSSLLSHRFIDKYGVALITCISVLMTALATLGISYTSCFLILCMLAIPLGLGGGSVDAALNNYVALYYKAVHMNWLHCFWGVGAAIGPLIMTRYLSDEKSWTGGYNVVGWIQLGVFIILLVSIPLWKHNTGQTGEAHQEQIRLPVTSLLKLPGVKQALLVFFCYCSLEATFGLWGSSFLVFIRGFKPEDAATLVTIYYGGITIGRFISGIMTLKLSNRQLIYSGQLLIFLGLIVLFLPFGSTIYLGFLAIGLGCAPIFPSLLHETPSHFGKEYSQAIMGLQMASAYIGITLMPLLFGKLASYTNYGLLLWFLGILLCLMIVMTLSLIRKISRNEI